MHTAGRAGSQSTGAQAPSETQREEPLLLQPAPEFDKHDVSFKSFPLQVKAKCRVLGLPPAIMRSFSRSLMM